MGWNKQASGLPAGGSFGQALIRSSSIDPDAAGWSSRAQLISSVNADTTLVNSVVDSSIAELVIPYGSAGDLFVVDAFGTIANSSGATVTYTFSLRSGDTGYLSGYPDAGVLMTTAAISIGTGAIARAWRMRALVALRTVNLAWIGATLTVSGTGASTWLAFSSGNSFEGVNSTAMALDTRATSIYLGCALGTASPNASITCRAAHTLLMAA